MIEKRKYVIVWNWFTLILFFNWVPFFVAARRVNYKKYAYWGIVYTIPFVLTCITSNDFTISLDLLGWIASIIHSFSLRKEYRMRLEVVDRLKPEYDQHLRRQIEKDYGVTSRPVTDNLVHADPQPSMKPSETVNHKVDINYASEEELAALPGIGRIYAKRVVAIREDRPFTSVDDLAKQLDLKPHIVEKLRSVVEFGEREVSNGSGRMVDF